MTEEEDAITKEVKRKQKYLKGSGFVEIRVELSGEATADVESLSDGQTVFTPTKQKSVRATEIRAKSGD